jgi:hypothetical protein
MRGKINTEIYIDKSFVRNFWRLDLSNEVVADFRNSFLLKSKNFILITNYHSLDEIKQNEEDLLFFEMLWEGTPEMEFLIETDREKWIDYPGQSRGYKLYFLEISNTKCYDLSKKCGYVILNTNLLINEWSKFAEKYVVKALDVLPRQGDQEVFNSWLDLAFIKNCPSNTIIILDRYILTDRKKQKVSDNLVPLILSIASVEKSKKIDVLIITEQISSLERSIDLNQRAMNIHKRLIKDLANKASQFNVSILIYNKAFQPESNPEFHDRIVYTNYYTIKCGVGFNLFDGRRRLIFNSEIEVHFNFQSYYMRALPRHLNSISNYFDKVERTEVLNQFKYYPDVQCALLGI